MLSAAPMQGRAWSPSVPLEKDLDSHLLMCSAGAGGSIADLVRKQMIDPFGRLYRHVPDLRPFCCSFNCSCGTPPPPHALCC